MRTWHVEALFVAIVLAGSALATGQPLFAWIGSLAVLLTFLHAQVGFRLQEAAEEEQLRLERELRSLSQRHEHMAEKPLLSEVKAAEGRLVSHVACYRWLGRYFLAKEVCWCAYFAYLGAWPALVGVGVFLAYPLWRRIHLERKRRSA